MRVKGQASGCRSEGLSANPAGLKAEASSARLSTVYVVGKHGRRSPQGVGALATRHRACADAAGAEAFFFLRIMQDSLRSHEHAFPIHPPVCLCVLYTHLQLSPQSSGLLSSCAQGGRKGTPVERGCHERALMEVRGAKMRRAAARRVLPVVAVSVCLAAGELTPTSLRAGSFCRVRYVCRRCPFAGGGWRVDGKTRFIISIVLP